MGRRRVEVEVALLDVLAVIALRPAEAEEPLLQDGIAPVPERPREAEPLVVVRDARDAVLAPAIGSRARVGVRQVLPGIAVAAIVLAHRAPLPLAQVGPPPLPVGRPLPRLAEARDLGRHGLTATRRCAKKRRVWRAPDPGAASAASRRARSARCRRRTMRQEPDVEAERARPAHRLVEDHLGAPRHVREERRARLAQPDQVVAAVLAGPEHEVGAREALEGGPQHRARQGRHIAADHDRPRRAVGQEVLERVREPRAQVIPALRHEGEVRGDRVKERARVDGRIRHGRARRGHAAHLVDRVEEECPRQLGRIIRGQRRAEARLHQARTRRLGHHGQHASGHAIAARSMVLRGCTTRPLSPAAQCAVIVRRIRPSPAGRPAHIWYRSNTRACAQPTSMPTRGSKARSERIPTAVVILGSGLEPDRTAVTSSRSAQGQPQRPRWRVVSGPRSHCRCMGSQFRLSTTRRTRPEIVAACHGSPRSVSVSRWTPRELPGECGSRAVQLMSPRGTEVPALPRRGSRGSRESQGAGGYREHR